MNESKVISIRVNKDLYYFFKQMNKPFSQTIPPLLQDYMNEINNEQCIHRPYNKNIHSEYERIEKLVDRLIRHL